MFKTLISAALVFRLHLREPPPDWGAVLLAWLHRPAIEITLPGHAQPATTDPTEGLLDNLNSVYPF